MLGDILMFVDSVFVKDLKSATHMLCNSVLNQCCIFFISSVLRCLLVLFILYIVNLVHEIMILTPTRFFFLLVKLSIRGSCVWVPLRWPRTDVLFLDDYHHHKPQLLIQFWTIGPILEQATVIVSDDPPTRIYSKVCVSMCSGCI